MHYICIVFFMVLDLRLMKIGCRETTFFCLYILPFIQYLPPNNQFMISFSWVTTLSFYFKILPSKYVQVL